MNRGKPLPWHLREEIRRRVTGGDTRRKVAAAMVLAHRTVVKYARGIRRGSLHQNRSGNS
jgi:hypothetical protein